MTTCLECGVSIKQRTDRKVLYCSRVCANRAHASLHKRPLAERFWEKVLKTETCWLWQGGSANGYGYIYDGVKVRRATHVAWELAQGPIPSGHWLLHHCDIPACVNSEDTEHHLWTGTHTDNMEDRDWKGRVASGARAGIVLHPEAFPRGSACWNTHFIEAQIKEIRQLHASGGYSYVTLGKQFNVHWATIRSIVKRRTWRHL